MEREHGHGARVPREEWLKSRLEAAERYACHDPGLKGRLGEIAALGIDEVADRVAEDLAGGCPDPLLGEIRADWAEFDPADVQERAVGLLLRLGAGDLVGRAEGAIRRYYQGRVGYVHPDTRQPDWTLADFVQMDEELAAVKEAVGRVVLGGPWGEPEAEVCSRVGRAVLRVVYADLLRDHEVVVDLWRRGDWQALHARGEIGAEELREYLAGYPAGNPNYPGWAGLPAGAEPDF